MSETIDTALDPAAAARAEHAAYVGDNDHTAPADDHVAHHPKDTLYLKVAVVLAVLTALETSTYWVDLGAAHTPVLLVMMVIKFVLVLLYFMHLKFDSKVCGAMFYAGMALTLMVYLGTLLTFRVF